MNNLPTNHLTNQHLASSYSALGRHDEAVALREETLAFHKRGMPEDHPWIATNMGNLASSYSA